MAAEGSLYVARDEDLSALQSHWEQAVAGTPRFVRLQAPFGGGRRALVGELLRGIQGRQEEAIVWRVTCLDQENGLQWLVRMYGSLVASLTADVLRRVGSIRPTSEVKREEIDELRKWAKDHLVVDAVRQRPDTGERHMEF